MGDTIDGLPSTGGRVNTFMDKLQGLFTNNRLARKRAADGYRGIRNVNDPYEDKDAITRRPARIWEDENLPNLITWEDNPDNIVDSRIEKSTSSVVDETANKTNAIIETEESALGDL
jgi:hypothetical protein